MSIPVGASLPGAETSPTCHTPQETPAALPAHGGQDREGAPQQAPHNSHGGGAPSTHTHRQYGQATLGTPCPAPTWGAQGQPTELLPQLRGLLQGHPSQCHLHACPTPLRHPAHGVPAPGLAPAPMPWGPSPTARPQYPHPGDSSPTAGLEQPYHGDPIPMAGPNGHAIALGLQPPHLAEPRSVAGPQNQHHGDPSPTAKPQHPR